MNCQSTMTPRDDVSALELVDEINRRLTQARTLAIVLRDDGFDGLSNDVRINTAWAIQTLTEDCCALMNRLWQEVGPTASVGDLDATEFDLSHSERPRGIAA